MKFEIAKVNLYPVIQFNDNVICQHLVFDVIAKCLYGFVSLFVERNCRVNLVGDLKITSLA